MPFGIAATVQRRIDHLPSDTQRTLRAAAVLGARCPLSLLAALVDCAETELMEHLAPAVAARFIRLESHHLRDGPPQCSFTHALARDALYAALPPAARRALHLRASEVLAHTPTGSSYGPATGTDAAVLAYHAERASAWQVAYDASLVAGDAAAAILAGRDALVHFNRARGLALAGHVSTAETETLALDRRLVATLRGIGRLEEAATGARVMAQRAAATGDRAAEAWAWIQFADAQTFAQRLEDAETGLERGRAIAEALGDGGLLAAALATRAVLFGTRGLLDEVEETLRQALPLADRAGNRAIALRGLVYAGFTANWRGRFGEAITAGQEAERLASTTHDPSSLADARFSLALALAGHGEYEIALAVLRDQLAFAVTSGEPYYAVRAPNTIGWIYRELALVDQALVWDERAVAESEEGNWPGRFKARANSLLNLGTDFILLGRLREAESALARVSEAVDQSDYMRWRTGNRLTLCRGELALARGEGGRALAYSAEAMAQATPTHAAKYIQQAHDLAGRSFAALGRQKEALARLEQGVTDAGAIGYRAGHWRGLAHLAGALQRQGRTGAAAERYAEAGLVVDAIAGGLRDPELHATFLAAPPVAEVLTYVRAARDSREEPAAYPDGLTAREAEILRLVAQGMTNRQIGDRLFLSVRTVERHILNAYGKTGTHGRAAVTAYVLRNLQ